MKDFEEEVWIAPTKTEPLWPDGLSFSEIPSKLNIYFHPAKRSRRKAIYFASRAHGRVTHVQRILRVEPSARPAKYIPELSNLKWAGEPHTVFHLGEPVKLPQPVKSGKIWNSLAYCDFDLLVSSQTVGEARKRTMGRKSKEPANPITA